MACISCMNELKPYKPLPEGMGASLASSSSTAPPPYEESISGYSRPRAQTRYFQLRHDNAYIRRHIATRGETLRVEEHVFSFSGDDFTIGDHEGNKRYLVEGNFLSWTNAKILKDMDERPLFQLSRAKLSLKMDQKVVDLMTGRTIMYMRKPKIFSMSLDIWKGDNDNGPLWAQARCMDWSLWRWEIVDMKTETPVGRLEKRWDWWKAMSKADSYVMHTSPGVDLSAMVLISIAIDEIRPDNRY